MYIYYNIYILYVYYNKIKTEINIFSSQRLRILNKFRDTQRRLGRSININLALLSQHYYIFLSFGTFQQGYHCYQ